MNGDYDWYASLGDSQLVIRMCGESIVGRLGMDEKEGQIGTREGPGEKHRGRLMGRERGREREGGEKGFFVCVFVGLLSLGLS